MCPCGRGVPFEECCAPYLQGRDAPTAEHLMRSRYTAFAMNDEDHLLRTWHPSTRPRAVPPEPGLRWTGLEILGTSGGSFLHTSGTVEFRASWVAGGTSGSMHEHSRFVREDGRWLYLDDGGQHDVQAPRDSRAQP